MRDEKRAGIVFAGLLTVFFIATKLYNQPVWKSALKPVANSVPAPAPAKKAVQPPPDFDDFVATFGSPTRIETSGRDQSHPPIATKWLDYEPEHVRVAFVAADAGEDPPRREWIAISYMDAVEDRPISAHDAGLRLSARRK